ncbi:MAG: DUF1840 family protein [Cocleimonas sp.]
MPVVFKTATSHRVVLLNRDANMMLKTFNTSGNIPGALYPEAIPDALESLKTRIKLESREENLTQNKDSDHVDINTRAFPLIGLMQSAIENNETLMWNQD